MPWGSVAVPLTKAQTTPPPAIYAADNRVAGLTAVIVTWLRGSAQNALEALKEQPTLDAFTSWVNGGALRSLLQTNVYVGNPNLQTEFLNTIHAGAQVGITQAHAKLSKAEGSFSISFDLINPRSLRFIETYLFSLIVGIDQQTRENIRTELYRAVQGQQTVREVARRLKEFIGLTPQQFNAVLNYRKMLETGKYREAMQNALRDRRFDPTLLRMITEQGQLSQAHIDKMVDRYTERYLAYRALTIARTEAIRAARFGQQESWRQMYEQGLLENPRQEWISSDDERSCKFCPEIPDMNPDGVPLDGLFHTPLGEIDGPPAHTSCRCSIALL